MGRIADNIQQVQAHITAACARVGRNPGDVTLVAVSKTHPAEMLIEAAAAGIQHFGENRVEEAEPKIAAVNAALPVPPIWHMLGHVQSRKAKQVAPLFDVVQSVDSVKLAQKFAALAEDQGRTIDILLEMNMAGEAQKDGFAAADWSVNPAAKQALWQDMEAVFALSGLRVRGLMTMAPFYDEGELARPVFAALARLRDDLSSAFNVPLPDLSMGMTTDFVPAIEEGATLVRIGRAIFGERA